MKELLMLACGVLISGCSNWCSTYTMISAAAALGDVPEASIVRATYETSIDGCAAVTSMYNQRPQPYSDMFPEQQNLAATQ